MIYRCLDKEPWTPLLEPQNRDKLYGGTVRYILIFFEALNWILTLFLVPAFQMSGFHRQRLKAIYSVHYQFTIFQITFKLTYIPHFIEG